MTRRRSARRARRHVPARVWVPNSGDSTVSVIDPRTCKVVRHFRVGLLPQHVTPSWDLRTLWVDNDRSNSLTPIDAASGRVGRPVPVADPYNLYFTPNGRRAVVVAERLRRLDFRDPHSLRLRHGAMPQDVKLAPDGRLFYVADMAAGGVWLVDGDRLRVVGFVKTGAGAHGLYTSRDSRLLFVSNRQAGSVSVVSFATRRVVATWRLPGGGSPDMGGVSADGRVLWLSGRYDAEVYAIDTGSGRLLARVPVGSGPHGLCVYPQPGRYSLGHTGVLR